MRYQIAICDDEQSELDSLASLAAEWGAASGHVCRIRTFLSAEAFLFEYAEELYDILLLDVEMKGMSGIELARRIRCDNTHTEIIFVTSHFEFCGEGYEVDALHYLVKPLSEKKLMPVLSKAAKRLAIKPLSLVITCDGEIVRLCMPDIFYVEAFLHYITICTKGGQYRCKESISSFSDRLGSDFFRIHRSYLVSLGHIVKISRTLVCLDNGKELPLARGKYDAMNRAFIEYSYPHRTGE